VGSGPQASQIFFQPTAAGVAITFTRGAAILFQGSLRNLALISTETTLNKVGVLLSDVSGFVIEDLAIGPVGRWTGADSIGVQLRGRDTSSLLRLGIAADIPISIEGNPNSGIDIDLFHFEDLTLVPGGTNPGVKIASGVNLTNVVFDGCNAVVGGGHAFYWSDTSTTFTSDNLTIRNLRWEHSTSTSGYIVYIAHNYALQNVVLEGIRGGSNQENNGFFLRKCKRVTFINTSFAGSSKDALNLEGCAEIAFLNAFWQEPNTVTLAGLEETFAPCVPQQTQRPLPATAFYEVVESGNKRVRIYGSKVWAKVGSMLDDATVPLPLGGGQKAGTVMVAAKGSTQFEGGSWIFTNGSVKKTGGTANTAATDTDGSLCVFPSGNAVIVRNRLGEAVDYDVFVTWY
jgi:hypothetical protein